MIFGIVMLFAQIVYQVVQGSTHGELSIEAIVSVAIATKDLLVTCFQSIYESNGFSVLSPAVKTTALLLFIGAWLIRRNSPIYLLSFSTFKSPDSWRVTHDQIVEMMRRQDCFTEESLNFMKRILERSGTGQATAWPPGIVKCLKGEPADRSIKASRLEAETIIYDVVEKALKKANVHPKEIDFLVINCSLFSPTPSLCAMVVSKFGMRSDTTTFNLSGMGCSASLISVDLAKKLLNSTRRKAKALVVSTEIITPNLYHGNDRGFLIQNTLFRCGGAAIVLSNSWMDGRRALFKLLHTVRVHGIGPESMECVYETEDKEDGGQRGVRLSKDIVKVAGKCMEKNLTTLGPLILPFTEQAKVVASLVARYFCKTLTKVLRSQKMDGMSSKVPVIKPYMPDFKRAVDHFCIHAGGRAVIDGTYLTRLTMRFCCCCCCCCRQEEQRQTPLELDK